MVFNFRIFLVLYTLLQIEPGPPWQSFMTYPAGAVPWAQELLLCNIMLAVFQSLGDPGVAFETFLSHNDTLIITPITVSASYLHVNHHGHSIHH